MSQNYSGANSAVGDVILPSLKLFQAFVVVLVTYKNEEKSIQNLKALEWSQHFEPIRYFIVVLVTCKNKEEPNINEGVRVVTSFSFL